jgi:AAA domain
MSADEIHVNLDDEDLEPEEQVVEPDVEPAPAKEPDRPPHEPPPVVAEPAPEAMVVHPTLGTAELWWERHVWQTRDGARSDGTPWPPAWVEEARRMLTEGTIITAGGEALTGASAQRMRDRVLGTYAHLPPRPLYGDLDGRRNGGTVGLRWLIPGLWLEGTIPACGGNPKAGKTTLVCGELVPALLVPGRRFLDWFAPSQMTTAPDDEAGRGVWVINAETSPAAFAGLLDDALGDSPSPNARPWAHPRDLVMVDHLELLGGAQVFDLTDPEIYRWWADRLIDCSVCDGTDDWSPFAVVVDGVSAILLAAGKPIEAFGLWYAAFRRLMREVDVPSALVTAHNTLSGGHLMGGAEAQAGPDGLWTYSCDDPDRPTSTRRFSVVPRLGGVAVPSSVVRLDPDGRLRMSAPSETPGSPGQPPGKADEAEAEAEVLADLVAAATAGLTTTEVTGGGGEVGVRRREARDRLVEAGKVVSRPDGRSTRWWATRFALAAL